MGDLDEIHEREEMEPLTTVASLEGHNEGQIRGSIFSIYRVSIMKINYFLFIL